MKDKGIKKNRSLVTSAATAALCARSRLPPDLASLTTGDEVKAVPPHWPLSVSQLLSRAWEPGAWPSRVRCRLSVRLSNQAADRPVSGDPIKNQKVSLPKAGELGTLLLAPETAV